MGTAVLESRIVNEDLPLLTAKVQMHDVHDVEAFVRDAIKDGKVRLTVDEHEELLAEGLRIMVVLDRNYEPGRNGLDPANSRFSGYAAKYLRVKLGDAWHRTQEHHQLRTGQDGKRKWHYEEKPASLDAMHANPGDTENGTGTDHIKALHVEDSYDHNITDALYAALDERWKHDRVVTVRIGALIGKGYTTSEAAKLLGVDGKEAASAVDRIKRVAHELIPA